MFPSSYWWDSFGSLLQTNLFKTRILPNNLSTKLFPIRFHDECLVSQKKHHYSFFLPTANAFAVVQFSNPSTKFFLLHFHFLSSDLLCLVSSVRRYQHYFCSNYPYHTISIYYRKLQKEKDKIFCYRKKNVKKINSNISIFSTYSVKITLWKLGRKHREAVVF